MNLGDNLKELRKKSNVSQEDLAKSIYVSRQTISNWENQKSYPDINNLVLLSVFFDTTLDWLVKGEIENMRSLQDIKKYKSLLMLSNFIILIGIASMIIGRRLLGDVFSIIIAIFILVFLCYSKKQRKTIELKNNITGTTLDIKNANDVLFMLDNPGISTEGLTIKRKKERTKNIISWFLTVCFFLLFIIIFSYISHTL